MKTNGSQNMLEAFIIRVSRDAVIGGRAVELGIKESLSLAVVKGAREHHVDASVLAAITGSSVVGAETGGGERKFQTFQLGRLAGNDVDHGEEGVGAVERRTGTANDFHAFDQI